MCSRGESCGRLQTAYPVHLASFCDSCSCHIITRSTSCFPPPLSLPVIVIVSFNAFDLLSSDKFACVDVTRCIVIFTVGYHLDPVGAFCSLHTCSYSLVLVSMLSCYFFPFICIAISRADNGCTI